MNGRQHRGSGLAVSHGGLSIEYRGADLELARSRQWPRSSRSNQRPDRPPLPSLRLSRLVRARLCPRYQRPNGRCDAIVATVIARARPTGDYLIIETDVRTLGPPKPIKDWSLESNRRQAGFEP